MKELVRQLIALLPPHERRGALLLLVMTAIGAGLEAVSIGLVFPVLAMIAEPGAWMTRPLISDLYRRSGMATPEAFVVACAFGLLVVFAAKTLFLAVLVRRQYRFIFRQQVALARRLLSAYLHAPYPYHLKHNSADMIRKVNHEVPWISASVLAPGAQVLSECLVLVIMLLMLIAIRPLPSLAASAALGALSAGYLLFSRTTATRMGTRQQLYQGSLVKWLSQALSSYKELRTLGLEQFFLEAHTRSSEQYALTREYRATATSLPRILIEGVAMLVLLGVPLVMLALGRDLRAIAPTLVLFGLALVRLLPSASRIVAGINTIQQHAHAVETVYRDLQELEASAPTLPPPGSASPRRELQDRLTLEQVGYTYAERDEPALDDVSLTILRGQRVAIVGASGAGKTTLADLLLGLLTPTTGVIRVDGNDLQDDLPAWQAEVGYIPQQIYLLDDTIRKNIAVGLADDAIDEARVWQALAMAQLDTFVRQLDDGLDTVVGENAVRVSGGQRQRLGIARALYRQPSVLVFDEATSSLDGQTEAELTQAIMGIGREKTVIVIAHRLSTVRSCDRLFYLEHGRLLAEGSFDELLASCPPFRTLAAHSGAHPDAAA